MLERGFRTLLSEAEALDRLLREVRPLDSVEIVDLAGADGRVLAAPVAAPRDAPHYDRCAMDGYAVRARDTAGASLSGPVVLELAARVAETRAARVHTGSALPAGADAVVPIEDAELDGARVAVLRRVREGEHVGSRGEDVRAGERLLGRGHVLRPPDLGLLRAVGVELVPVRPRPRVRVLVTGEELVPPGVDPPDGRMVDSNGLMLSAAVERWGGEPDIRGVYGDDLQTLASELDAAGGCDLLVTSGGTSVGVRDRVVEALRTRGEVWFHGVAIQPARPVAAGRVSGIPALCLPGFPAATFVAAFALLRPVLARLGGSVPAPRPALAGVLARKIVSTLGLRTYARVAVRGDAVEPVRAAGAGLLSSLSRADGFVVIPEDSEGLPEGAFVEVAPFP